MRPAVACQALVLNGLLRLEFKNVQDKVFEESLGTEDKITVDLKTIGATLRSWINSAQKRGYWRALVNAALNLRVP